jgi:1-acyl-sn-glycerol-3-phosphate acyltransferase
MLANLRGAFTLALIVLNIVFWFCPILVFAIVRLLLPFAAVRRVTSRILVFCGESWISCNNAILALTQSIEWDIRGLENLRRREWYLVVSNHQSWIDILVLQRALNRRIPFLKFFIKQQLIWVPFLGIAWWAMDMPFMKRHSPEYLKRHPDKRGADLVATRRACEKFREIPTSVINFVEGTRFTPAKHEWQERPYRNLLRPRAGGVAFAMSVMGDIFHSLVDVTIVYPDGSASLWDLCCGRVRRVIVDVRERPLERWQFAGDYVNDELFRARFQGWVSELWREKDDRIDELLAERRRAA